MDSLSPETLVHIFSYIRPTDLIEVAHVSRQWNCIVSDDQLWHSAFLHLFTRAPLSLNTNNTKNDFKGKGTSRQHYWQREYLRRFRLVRLWSGSLSPGGRRQFGAFRFKDVGGGKVQMASLTHDRHGLHVVSGTCLVHAIFNNNAVQAGSSSRLKRSLLMLSGPLYADSTGEGEDRLKVTMTGVSDRRQLAVGLDDGRVAIYDRIPINSTTRGFRVLKPPPLPSHDVLPVLRIWWFGEERLAVLCRRQQDDFPQCRLYYWDSVKEQLLHTVELLNIEHVSILPNHHNQADHLAIAHRNSQGEYFVKSTLGWEFIRGKDRILGVSLIDRCQGLLVISERCISLLDPFTGVAQPNHQVSVPSKIVIWRVTPLRVLFVDESNALWSLTFNGNDADGDVEDGMAGELRQLNVKIPTIVLDVYCDDGEDVGERQEGCILALLTRDCLMLFDALSLSPLGSHVIPRHARRVSGADIGPDGTWEGRILSFHLPLGQLLIRWGAHTIHYWNFGAPLPWLTDEHHRHGHQGARRGSFTSPRGKATELTLNLRDDLDAIEDAKEEAYERQRLAQDYSLQGMSEADMLRYAQMLSLEKNTTDRLPSTSTADEDYELQLALALSLSEQQP